MRDRNRKARELLEQIDTVIGAAVPPPTYVNFSDDEADTLVVEAKSASTPAHIQTVAAKVENVSADAPSEVRAEVADAKQAAASAKTPAEVSVAKDKVQKAIKSVQKSKAGFLKTNVPGLNYPAWQVGLGAVGLSVVGYGLYRFMRSR